MSTTTIPRLPAVAWEEIIPADHPHHRRFVSFQARRALRTLRHAIEYVAGEFLHDSVPPSIQNPRLQAVQLLIELQGDVYADCPEIPRLFDLAARKLGLRRTAPQASPFFAPPDGNLGA